MEYREFKAQFRAENPDLSPGQRNARCRKAWEAQATAEEKKAEAKRRQALAAERESNE